MERGGSGIDRKHRGRGRVRGKRRESGENGKLKYIGVSGGFTGEQTLRSGFLDAELLFCEWQLQRISAV
ncbi:hypothetical protein TIFTF001_038652 [Ficus carica]|uniref:Uncharacterized protein n=1 Tax=Ficus carica TaxID=3494 RepID=A0AA88JD96_FICCA|nr:hypothetical protein TIFTF001_038652 [Ficus carica]